MEDNIHSWKLLSISPARRIGYAKYDNAHRDWIGNAATPDLISLHEADQSTIQDNALLLAIGSVELNLRSSLKFANAAYG